MGESCPRAPLPTLLQLKTKPLTSTQLHALYLNRRNEPLLRRLYLPSSPLLSYPLHHTLEAAASAEILKTTRASLILPEQLLADATSALEALSTLLGTDEWFLGGPAPSPFDAEVFAYTWLLLDGELGWGDDELGRCLLGFENLVAHRERLYRRCWDGKAG